MLKNSLQLICILSLFMLSGCWDLQEINESAITTAAGIERQDDDKIAFSTRLIRPLPSGEAGSGEMEWVVATASDYSVAMAARRLTLSLSKVPEWSHVKTFILGEKLVGHDLSLVIDFMTRNRHLRPDINLLIVSQSSPEEVLSSNLPQVTELGSGLHDLLKLNEKQLGIYVPITMGEFTYKLMTPGIEPVVPQITLEMAQKKSPPEKSGDKNSGNTNNINKINLNGMGVLKGKRLVGVMNETESRGYRWLNSSSQAGGLFNAVSPWHENEHIALEIVRFSTKTRPQLSSNNLKMIIEIDSDLGFYEQDFVSDILNLERKDMLQEAANQEIEKQVAACINKAQFLGSDVLGWGRILQEHEPDKWKEIADAWSEQFPLVEYEIHIKSNIIRTMLTSKSFYFK